MGRKARPVADRLLDGTHRPDRHGLPPDDGGGVERLERPSSLSGRAAEVWDEYVSLLSGVVRRRDVMVLEELCWWKAQSEKLRAVADAADPTDKGHKQLVIQAGIASDKVAKLSALFGLNPTDRAKVPQGEGPRAAKVPTRPRTKLDAQGGGRDDEA